jgi:hypothetical protein
MRNSIYSSQTAETAWRKSRAEQDWDGSEFLTSAAENRSRPRLSKSTPHFRGID